MAESDVDVRRLRRRRRANVTGGRQLRHEVKVSEAEEAVLVALAEAQHMTVPRLLVEAALASPAGETVTDRREAMAALFGVHRLLAAVSNNVNQIARATNATGQLQAETGQTLAAVRRVADRIDRTIDVLSR